MAKTKISEYDSTAANNTDIDGINIAESCAPSGINNAIREQMAHLKDGLGAGTPVFLDQTNNRLGVGTTSPTGSVHISSSAPTFFMTDTTNNTEAVVSMDNAGSLILNADLNNEASSSNIRFAVDGTERMRIDSSGNVGIGTDSPSTILTLKRDSAGTSQSDYPLLSLDNGNANGFSQLRFADDGSEVASIISHSADKYLIFRAGGSTERMRLTSDGRLGINNNAPDYLFSVYTSAMSVAAEFGRNTDSSQRTMMLFRSNSQGANVGSIQVTNSATAYNTSSDHRLKENVETLSGGITRVKQLKPKRFSWIVDEEDSANMDGFLAHEAQTVVPEAVSGTHNGTEPIGNVTDGDGNTVKKDVTEPETLDEGHTWTATGTQPVMQGIDQAKLVPLLTAALQEAIAKIEALETRVAALEG